MKLMKIELTRVEVEQEFEQLKEVRNFARNRSNRIFNVSPPW